MDQLQLTAQKGSPESPIGHYDANPLGEERPQSFLGKRFLLLKTPSILS